jgi:DNA-binding NarL/FixJ family response regulator
MLNWNNTMEDSNLVLIVDEDPETIRILGQALSPPWQIQTAAGSEEAASALRDRSPCVAVVNLDLPGMGGMNLLWLLRQVRPRTRMIVFTAESSSSDVIRAIREHVFGYFSKPLVVQAVVEMIAQAAAAAHWEDGIEVLSARPGWISLRLRCRQLTADRLLQFFRELKMDVSEQEREDVATAFREMLLNAIEHGGHYDPNQMVRVSYYRLTKAVVYLIQDPGEGFSFSALPQAAVSNPANAPAAHLLYRSEHGLRAGGFGILFARKLVDEVIHNEEGNEVILVKYLTA